MSSPHFRTAAKYLVENIESLSGQSGVEDSQQKTFWNISNALLALADALEDEFRQLENKLTSIQMHLPSGGNAN